MSERRDLGIEREDNLFVLPPEPHLPGRTPRPAEALFEPLKAGLSPELSADDLAASPAFRGGLEAFRAGYYWEAHELWEAVWICLPPASAERLLVQGMIQLANAGLKNRMGQRSAAARILALADATLQEVAVRRVGVAMDMTPERLSAMRSQAVAEGTRDNAL